MRIVKWYLSYDCSCIACSRAEGGWFEMQDHRYEKHRDSFNFGVGNRNSDESQQKDDEPPPSGNLEAVDPQQVRNFIYSHAQILDERTFLNIVEKISF